MSPRFKLKPRTRFLAGFAAIVISLYVIVAIRPVNDRVIVPFTALIAKVTGAILIAVGQDVSVSGVVVQGPGASIAIENGCNGLEAIIVLAGAVCAFPAPWRSRLLALLAGSIGLQLLNLVRTTSLYLFLKYRPGLFNVLHTSVWQTILVAAAVVFFLLWSSKQRVGGEAEPAA
ncbi:MAG: exosortase H [Acidobacteria bacterium]|nr:exosortase H [Acidobacteriota bacterium]